MILLLFVTLILRSIRSEEVCGSKKVFPVSYTKGIGNMEPSAFLPITNSRSDYDIIIIGKTEERDGGPGILEPFVMRINEFGRVLWMKIIELNKDITD